MLPQGLWRSRGYGWILRVDSAGYALFDTVPGRCIEFERGSPQDFDQGFELVNADGGDMLLLSVRNDITRYEFSRIDRLPDDVLLLEHARRTDPVECFEFFVSVFDSDYGFFKLRGVDWRQLSAKLRSRVHDDSTPDELFDVLHALIRPLHDNHVSLRAGDRRVGSDRVPGIRRLVRDALDLVDAGVGHYRNVTLISEFVRSEFLADQAQVAGNGAVNWGRLPNGIGYLNVIRLFGLADTPGAKQAVGLPPRRPDHARFLQDDLAAIESIMDRVMADLANVPALIVDVRLNGGGFDKVGMAIANRFADRRRLAFTKQARDGSGLTPCQEFHVQPHPAGQFTGPVYLLTSARTASAGDIFALCMRELPHVTLVGEPSNGILSDDLLKHLPNGWLTTISNEYYLSAAGLLFEGPGVPVDVDVPVFVSSDFRSGYRLAVDTAVQMAQSATDHATAQ